MSHNIDTAFFGRVRAYVQAFANHLYEPTASDGETETWFQDLRISRARAVKAQEELDCVTEADFLLNREINAQIVAADVVAYAYGGDLLDGDNPAVERMVSAIGGAIDAPGILRDENLDSKAKAEAFRQQHPEIASP